MAALCFDDVSDEFLSSLLDNQLYLLLYSLYFIKTADWTSRDNCIIFCLDRSVQSGSILSVSVQLGSVHSLEGKYSPAITD